MSKHAVSNMTKAQLIEYINTLPTAEEYEKMKTKYNIKSNALKEIKDDRESLRAQVRTLQNEVNTKDNKHAAAIKKMQEQANTIIQQRVGNAPQMKADLDYAQNVLGVEVDLHRLLDRERQHNSAVITEMVRLYERAVLNIKEEE